MDKKELEKMWKGERRMGGADFAGLAGLKAFANGRTLTNSARSTFMNCRRRYQYTYVYGLAPRKPVIPFLVGGLFHDGLERMYKTGEFDEAAERLRVSKACEKAADTPGLVAEDSDKIWVQQAIVMGALKGYFNQYLEKDLKQWDIVSTEGSFSIELPGGWTYRGKTDMIIREKKSGKLKLVEHKTAGVLNASYVAKLPLDNQILGYAWSQANLAKSPLKLDGVVYNVTKKPGIRQKQSESLREYYKRIEQEYEFNPGGYFYRESLSFSSKDLKRFSDELKRFVTEIDRCHDEDFFYQNTTHCTAMGVCPFMKLCLDGVNKDTLMHYRIKDRAHEELPEEPA